MKNNLILVILSLVFSAMFRESQAQDDRYDAWYRKLVKEYTLNPDGSMDYRYRKEQKLLTYRAFQSLYGETFVVYDPAFQELKVNESYTLMADGRKVTTPDNAFNEVLPGFAANAPAYNSLREMVITHTALERNATVVLDYTIHTKKGGFPALGGDELLAENEPVQSLEVRVRIPAGSDLYYKVLNLESAPEEGSDGTYRVFTWKFSDLSALSPEEAQPGVNERYPRLIFSSTNDRQAAFSFFTDRPAFIAAITDDMKKEIVTIAGDNRNRFETALKIQEMVVNDLRLCPIPLRYVSYRCRTPEETWNSNGGTAAEKAVLLASLLRAAGIESQVAGICRTAFTDEKIPVLSDLDDFAVKISNDEHGPWYLSVTSLNDASLTLTLRGRSFVALGPGRKPDLTRAEDPEQVVKVQGKFIVSSDPKLTGEVSIYYEGSVYPSAGMVRDRKKMKNSLSGGLIGNDTANLKKSTLNPANGFQTWIAASDKPFTKDSAYFYFTLPASVTGIDAWGVRTLSAKRETPFEIPSAADESYSYEVELPAALQVFTPDKKLALSNKAGTFLWEVRTDGRKVSVKRQLKLTERVFEGSGYEDLKVLMDAWNNPWYRQLVFLAGGS